MLSESTPSSEDRQKLRDLIEDEYVNAPFMSDVHAHVADAVIAAGYRPQDQTQRSAESELAEAEKLAKAFEYNRDRLTAQLAEAQATIEKVREAVPERFRDGTEFMYELSTDEGAMVQIVAILSAPSSTGGSDHVRNG